MSGRVAISTHLLLNNHRIEQISKFQDGHTCTNNVIFHEVADMDMAPCGGGCHSLDFFSAFNAKSFAVAIVSSKDFTLLASNKLFQKMLQKENEMLIGSYMPHLMRGNCKHIETYLKRCDTLILIRYWILGRTLVKHLITQVFDLSMHPRDCFTHTISFVCSCVELLEKPLFVNEGVPKQHSGQDAKDNDIQRMQTFTANVGGSTKGTRHSDTSTSTSGFASDNTSSILSQPRQPSQLPPESPSGIMHSNSLPLRAKPKREVGDSKAGNLQDSAQGAALLANMMSPTQLPDCVVAKIIADNSQHSPPDSPPQSICPNPGTASETGSASTEPKPSPKSQEGVCGQRACGKARVSLRTPASGLTAGLSTQREKQPAVEPAISSAVEPKNADTELDAEDAPKMNTVAKRPRDTENQKEVALLKECADAKRLCVATSAKERSTEDVVPKSDVPLISGSYDYTVPNGDLVAGQHEGSRPARKSCVTLLLRFKDYIVSPISTTPKTQVMNTIRARVR